jgi:hypothetical protein
LWNVEALFHLPLTGEMKFESARENFSSSSQFVSQRSGVVVVVIISLSSDFPLKSSGEGKGVDWEHLNPKFTLPRAEGKPQNHKMISNKGESFHSEALERKEESHEPHRLHLIVRHFSFLSLPFRLPPPSPPPTLINGETKERKILVFSPLFFIKKTQKSSRGRIYPQQNGIFQFLLLRARVRRTGTGRRGQLKLSFAETLWSFPFPLSEWKLVETFLPSGKLIS